MYMTNSNSQLSKWVLANWPRKVDKRTGLGNPNDNGIIGYGIFDLYQNIKDGQLYAWTISVEDHESDPDFIGYVDSVDTFESFLPLETGKKVVIVKDFIIDPYTFKTGVILTATEDILGVTGLSGRIQLSNTSGSWEVVGSGADHIPHYTNLVPVPEKVGGIDTGTTFDNLPISQVLDMLLYPYQYPSFTSFSIGGLSGREVGSIIQESQRSVSWNINNDSNLIPESIELYDVTNNIILSSNLGTSPKLLQFPSYSSNEPATQSFKIEATNTNGDKFSRNTSITWRWREFYGESTLSNLDATEVAMLRGSTLASNYNGTYVMVEGGYKYFAWPVSFGIPSAFKDQSTNLDVAMESPYTITIQNSFGISTDYNIFRTTNILGGSITIMVT